MSEMEKALGLSDKVLAEFVLELAKKSRTVMDFEDKLKANGADFSGELVSSMFALITKMLPECYQVRAQYLEDERPLLLVEKSRSTETDKAGQSDAKDRREELGQLFPSLALRNRQRSLSPAHEGHRKRKHYEEDSRSEKSSRRR